MTPERARYILSRSRYGSLPHAFRWRDDSTEQTYPDGITREEDAEIKSRWRRMPGYTSYADALRRIAGRDAGNELLGRAVAEALAANDTSRLESVARAAGTYWHLRAAADAAGVDLDRLEEALAAI